VLTLEVLGAGTTSASTVSVYGAGTTTVSVASDGYYETGATVSTSIEFG